MSDGFKDFLTAIILLTLLTTFFSVYGTPYEGPELNGNWKIYSERAPRKGDTGKSIPGKGSKPAETVLTEDVEPEETETAEKITRTSIKRVGDENAPTKETEEDHNKMDGMIIAFWHGVAAVLIGETSALLVAFVWTKIRKEKE